MHILCNSVGQLADVWKPRLAIDGEASCDRGVIASEEYAVDVLRESTPGVSPVIVPSRHEAWILED